MMKSKKDVKLMTPVRFHEVWKVEGQTPFCITTTIGLSGVYRLDEISSFIWLLMDGAHTVDSIISEVCNNFPDAERNQVEPDIVRVLNQMDADDLIILDYNSLHPYKKLNQKTIKTLIEQTNEALSTGG